MLFAVRLLTPSAAQTAVRYSTSPGTASPASDYIHTSGALTFAAGEIYRAAAVAIRGDETIEPDETFTVTLSEPTGGAAIAVGTATGTILDDDEHPMESAMDLYLPMIRR